jgi:chromosome segregation ATPase
MQVVEKEGIIEDLTRQLEEAKAALTTAQAEAEKHKQAAEAAAQNAANSEEMASLEEAITELTQQNVELQTEVEALRASAQESADKAAKYEDMMGRLKEML